MLTTGRRCSDVCGASQRVVETSPCNRRRVEWPVAQPETRQRMSTNATAREVVPSARMRISNPPSLRGRLGQRIGAGTPWTLRLRAWAQRAVLSAIISSGKEYGEGEAESAGMINASFAITIRLCGSTGQAYDRRPRIMRLGRRRRRFSCCGPSLTMIHWSGLREDIRRT